MAIVGYCTVHVKANIIHMYMREHRKVDMMEWQEGMRAKMNNGPYSGKPGTITVCFGRLCFQVDGVKGYYPLSALHETDLDSLASVSTQPSEVDCSLCQRKNDSGYKSCWWCGALAQ